MKLKKPILKGKRCLYCDCLINKISPFSLIEEDPLCIKCRKALNAKWRKDIILNMEVYSLYTYDGLFKTMLLQYKEIYDEALKRVFLNPYAGLLRLYFHGYTIVYVLSRKSEIEKRGFNHLQGIFEACHFKVFDKIAFIEERSQKGKTKEERLKMRKNYKLTQEINPKSKVLIVDDVLTTGSSIKGIYDLFDGKVKKVKVLSLSLSHPPKKKGLSKTL